MTEVGLECIPMEFSMANLNPLSNLKYLIRFQSYETFLEFFFHKFASFCPQMVPSRVNEVETKVGNTFF